MIDKYLKLLDSFKEEDIARFLKDLREKIISTLQGPYFNRKATCFFNHPNENAEPFSNFDSEPKQIVQFKQLVNALYHAQLAFEDLQSVNLRNGDHKFQDLKRLYYKTIEHGYKASYLLTHLDLDFHELFRGEIQQLWQFLAPIKEFANSHKDSAIEFSSALKNYPLGYKTGSISGTAIAQMKPNDGNYDYDFLTHFGAVLPGYIHQLTTYIQHYGPHISTYQPTIDKAKLEELQEQSFRLLNSIKNLQSDDIFISFKALNYIKIIREIINLSMTSLEQIGYANESSQEVICHNIRRLKYELLPNLFSLADHLEDECLLNPGTLSQPMMAQIKPFYELMAFYAAKFVDFAAKGEELLTIEDAQFVDMRLEKTRQRISTAHLILIKQTPTQLALNNFFTILENPQNSNYSLLNLPQEQKDALKREYKFLFSYVKAINPELSNLIIRDLKEESNNSYSLLGAWRWLTGSAPVAVTSLIPLKMQLQTALAKERATQELHIELNNDIISFVENHADVEIYPYKYNPELSGDNEAKILNIDPNAPENKHFQFRKDANNFWITNPAGLTFNQAETLAHYYERKCLQLNEANSAWQSFLSFLYIDEHTRKINTPQTKLKLRRWYSLFQSHLIENLVLKDHAREKDRTMVEFLTDQSSLRQIPTKPQMLLNYSKDNYIGLVSTLFKDLFTEEDISSVFLHFYNDIYMNTDLAKRYTELAKQKYTADVTSRELAADINTEKRAHFVLKHTDYSQTVAAYRTSLFELTKAFNASFRKQLQPAKKGIPFPEIENPELARLEIQQIIGVKRIFNSLHHLEQICIQLESLDQTSSQSIYVYHLIQAKCHIDILMHHAKALTSDPHFSLFAAELKDKALAIYKAFMEQHKNYVVGSEEVELTNPQYQGKIVKYSGLWYSLHSFMLIPEHIKASLHHQELSAETKEKVNQRTKQAALNIEGIIESSHSYFQLFLQTPTMYGLYKELKAKLDQFTHLSYNAAIDHLEELNNDLFVRILITTDEWEDKLGLQPGLLANPMKALLDEFHKGLLEPLDLDSQEHLALLSSLVPINYRMEAAKKRKQTAVTLLEQKNDSFVTNNVEMLNIDEEQLLKLPLANKFALLQLFTNEINEYFHKNHILPSSPIIQEINKTRLIKLYKMLQPLFLVEQKNLGLIAQPIESKYQSIEDLLQQAVPLLTVQEEIKEKEVKNEEPKDKDVLTEFKSDKFVRAEDGIFEIELEDLTPPEANSHNKPTSQQKPDGLKNIVYIAGALLNHYQGCMNSLQFEISTAGERLTYLDECIVLQEKESEKFRFEYTKKAFARELERLTSRYIGLYYTRTEYNITLQSFLQTDAPAIIEQSQYAQDINAEIKKLLGIKAEEFDKVNQAKFSQLEAVMNALAQFHSYFGKTAETINNQGKEDVEASKIRKHSFFETESTLLAKIQLIDKLTTIAQSKESVEKRLQDIVIEVKKPSFVAILQNHRHYNTLSFAWIAQCIISLLSALHLYTPKYKLLLQRLEKAVPETSTTEPSTTTAIRVATNPFSMFASTNPSSVPDSSMPQNDNLSVNPIIVS